MRTRSSSTHSTQPKHSGACAAAPSSSSCSELIHASSATTVASCEAFTHPPESYPSPAGFKATMAHQSSRTHIGNPNCLTQAHQHYSLQLGNTARNTASSAAHTVSRKSTTCHAAPFHEACVALSAAQLAMLRRDALLVPLNNGCVPGVQW